MADSFDKIFRSFFGLNRGCNDRNNDSFILPNEEEDDDGGTFHGGFFEGGEGRDARDMTQGFWGGGGGDGGDMFSHFHQDMQQQMEALNKQMEEMFSSIGSQDFPAGGFLELPAADQPQSPRDRMLKDTPSPDLSPDTPTQSPLEPPRRFPSIFSWGFNMPQWRGGRPMEKADRDMDGEIDGKDVAKLFDSPNPSPSSPKQGHFFSQHNHVSIQTRQGANGRLEQRKTVRGSDGQEETTVTRSVGDKSHSVTTKTDSLGHTEIIQSLQNMDEKDLPSFEETWNNKNDRPYEPSSSPRNDMLVPRKEPDYDPPLFKSLFGFDLPGLPGRKG